MAGFRERFGRIVRLLTDRPLEMTIVAACVLALGLAATSKPDPGGGLDWFGDGFAAGFDPGDGERFSFDGFAASDDGSTEADSYFADRFDPDSRWMLERRRCDSHDVIESFTFRPEPFEDTFSITSVGHPLRLNQSGAALIELTTRTKSKQPELVPDITQKEFDGVERTFFLPSLDLLREGSDVVDDAIQAIAMPREHASMDRDFSVLGPVGDGRLLVKWSYDSIWLDDPNSLVDGPPDVAGFSVMDYTIDDDGFRWEESKRVPIDPETYLGIRSTDPSLRYGLGVRSTGRIPPDGFRVQPFAVSLRDGRAVDFPPIDATLSFFAAEVPKLLTRDRDYAVSFAPVDDADKPQQGGLRKPHELRLVAAPLDDPDAAPIVLFDRPLLTEHATRVNRVSLHSDSGWIAIGFEEERRPRPDVVSQQTNLWLGKIDGTDRDTLRIGWHTRQQGIGNTIDEQQIRDLMKRHQRSPPERLDELQADYAAAIQFGRASYIQPEVAPNGRWLSIDTERELRLVDLRTLGQAAAPPLHPAFVPLPNN